MDIIQWYIDPLTPFYKFFNERLKAWGGHNIIGDYKYDTITSVKFTQYPYGKQKLSNPISYLRLPLYELPTTIGHKKLKKHYKEYGSYVSNIKYNFANNFIKDLFYSNELLKEYLKKELEAFKAKKTDIVNFLNDSMKLRVEKYLKDYEHPASWQKSYVDGCYEFLRGNNPARVVIIEDIVPTTLFWIPSSTSSDYGLLFSFISDTYSHRGHTSPKIADDIRKDILSSVSFYDRSKFTKDTFEKLTPVYEYYWQRNMMDLYEKVAGNIKYRLSPLKSKKVKNAAEYLFDRKVENIQSNIDRLTITDSQIRNEHFLDTLKVVGEIVAFTLDISINLIPGGKGFKILGNLAALSLGQLSSSLPNIIKAQSAINHKEYERLIYEVKKNALIAGLTALPGIYLDYKSIKGFHKISRKYGEAFTDNVFKKGLTTDPIWLRTPLLSKFDEVKNYINTRLQRFKALTAWQGKKNIDVFLERYYKSNNKLWANKMLSNRNTESVLKANLDNYQKKYTYGNNAVNSNLNEQLVSIQRIKPERPIATNMQGYFDKIKNNRLIKEAITSPSEKCEFILSEVADFMQKNHFTNIQYRAMLIWNSGLETLPTNHFVVKGIKHGEPYIFDLTAHQFANKGMPSINSPLLLSENEWLGAYQNSFERKLIKFKDFERQNDATMFASIWNTPKVSDPIMGGFILKKPSWYKNVLADPPMPLPSNLNLNNPSRNIANKLFMSESRGSNVCWEFATEVLERKGEQLIIGKTDLNNLFKLAARGDPESMRRLLNLHHENISSMSKLISIEEGRLVMFTKLDGNVESVAHVATSVGGGKFAGINQMSLTAPDGIVTAEQFGIFYNGKLRPHHNFNNDLNVYSIDPRTLRTTNRRVNMSRVEELLGPDSEFVLHHTGVLQVKAHGDTSSINYLNGMELTNVIKGLAIAKNIDLSKVNLITLKACYGATGDYPIGQQVADLINKQVKAYKGIFSEATAINHPGATIFSPNKDFDILASMEMNTKFDNFMLWVDQHKRFLNPSNIRTRRSISTSTNSSRSLEFISSTMLTDTLRLLFKKIEVSEYFDKNLMFFITRVNLDWEEEKIIRLKNEIKKELDSVVRSFKDDGDEYTLMLKVIEVLTTTEDSYDRLNEYFNGKFSILVDVANRVDQIVN